MSAAGSERLTAVWATKRTEARSGDADPEVAPEGQGERVDEDDRRELLEQHAETRAAVQKLVERVQNAHRDAEGAIVELYGVAGNPGLSQQVAALRESHRSTRRELAVTRRQINEFGKALREQMASLDARLLQLGVDMARRSMLERVIVGVFLVVASLACLAAIGWFAVYMIDRSITGAG